MRVLPVAAALSLIATSALAQTAAPPAATPPAPTVTASLVNAQGEDAGTVTGYRGPLGMLFVVDGKGWPEGWHGVHLHAVGTCEGPGFTSAGAHVNHPDPQKRAHGLLNSNGGPDLGDLQNVYAAADGTARAEVYLSGAGLVDGPGQDLLDGDGLSFLVHANRDDHFSQPIGGAGDRIACGVFQPVAAHQH